MDENANQKTVKIWKRKNIHLVNEENDIKFHGPLSYRHLRIAGWIFLFLAQLGVILGIANGAKLIEVNPTLLTILNSVSGLMTPLFLFAAFSQVLVAKDGYRRLITTYLLGAIGIYALIIIIYLHFGVGLLHAISGDWEESFVTATVFINAINSSGTLSLNIFIDLLLCALVTFFINYRPTKYFQGEKLYIFRSLVAIPIIYELGSIALKLLASTGTIMISPFVIPLLTTKPPVAFLIFIVLALFVKNRERFYVKKGKTHEDYKNFLNTNVNRLHFSLTLVYTIIGAVILDILLWIIISAINYNVMLVKGIDPSSDDLIVLAITSTYNMGFGKCLLMVFIIPLIIFFDYTKTYTNKKIDLFIPIVGIGLLAILYIEGLFEIAKAYLIDMARKAKEAEESGGIIISYIRNIFKK